MNQSKGEEIIARISRYMPPKFFERLPKYYVGLNADELRSFRTLQSNKSSILRRSYSHKSNNSSKSHGSSRSRTNKYSRSSKYASKNGMDDQYEDEDEEMIVSQI